MALGMGAVTAGSASASSQRHKLQNRPAWLGTAQAKGALPSGQRLSFSLLLTMRNQPGADAQVRALSDPSSASYGKWLSLGQFNSAYGPTKAQTASVSAWARSQGLHVDSVAPSGMLVNVSGTTSTVEKVFATSMRSYRFKGVTVRANTTALSLPTTTPAAVVSAVKGIVGLDTGAAIKKPADTLPGPPPGARYGVQPCSSYYGQKMATNKPTAYGKHWPYAVCGYTPKQLQHAYGVTKQLQQGHTGKGQTVVITDAYAAPTIAADLRKYNAKYGLPQFKHGQFTQQTPGPDGYDLVNECGGNGWYGEETLDVEAVHTMAPGAKIVYAGAPDCASGLDNTWAAAIDNHTGDVITNSWSDGVDDLADLGQSYIDFYQQYSTEAALRGITVNFSSGDAGDGTDGGANLAAKTVGFPSDLPYVTGVGGTSLDINRRSTWAGEWGWQNAYSALSKNGKSWTPAPPGAYSSGGGGGTSQLFAQPWYQKGIVPSSVADFGGTGPMRAVPDISMVGDPNTGMIVGETQAFPDGTYWDTYRIGGTSLSSPLLAGMVAVASSRAHHALGFVNPLYYSMLDGRGLHDLKAPTAPLSQVRTNYANTLDRSGGLTFQLQRIDTQMSTLHDTRGWDDETGVGSPASAFFRIAARR
ncbi:serine protease [Leekyejoonella antrihumi]|uniref:Serine protease n=2 Tax=Leekyejoonella antrihumi TaxID=1660198 RepID=A0A563DV20_9MICO|nr:serine protease [Leekyejoonella antrihumi]